MGGGKVTPITLFDDNAYSDQSETDEEEEDDNPKKTRGSDESSVYLGKHAYPQRSCLVFGLSPCITRVTLCFYLHQGCSRDSSTSNPL